MRWEAHSLLEMFHPLLLMLFLALVAEKSTCSGFQPESATRSPWVGPKLRLALRQAKRSQEMLPGKLDQHAGKEWTPVQLSYNSEAEEISGNRLDGVAAKAEHLAETIKTLQQAIEAKEMIEPIQKRSKADSPVRILKYCNWYMCY